MSISLLPSVTTAHGNVTVITEQLDSPAEFFLHRVLSSVLKEGTPCILVSTWNDLTHWSTIQSRSNFSLSAQITSKRLTFLDALALLESFDGNPTRLLKEVFNQISNTLTSHATTAAEVCVMIEDLSHLSWIGATEIEVSRFYRAVRGACLKAGASLIAIFHTVASEPPGIILRDLLSNCHVVMNVLPLSSGRSGSVSGEITTRPGPWDVELVTVPVKTKKTALQYRLTDFGVVFFQKGTAGGIL